MSDEILLLDRWCEMKRHNQGRSEYTVYAYRLYLLRLRAYLQGKGMDWLSADAATIEYFAGPFLHEQKMRPISRCVPIAAIRGFYTWLTQKKLIDDNPAQCLSQPKAGRRLPRPMQFSNAEKLLLAPGLGTFMACRDTAIIAVLIGSGCRVSGLTRLNERDLIWTQNAAGTERLVIRLTEKGKQERMVPIPMEASLLVRAYLGHPELQTIDRTLPNGDQVLFVSLFNRRVPPHEYHGEQRRLTAWSIHDLIRRYGLRCGLPVDECHPHALRHLYGTELAEHDVDLLQRQALLGHVRPETTEVYTRLAMRKLTAVVERSNPMVRMKSNPAHALAERLRGRG